MNASDVLASLPPWPVLLSRLMLLVLVAVLAAGVADGRRGVVLTCLIAIAVAKLPSVLERDYGIELVPGLTLWLTTAVFLHAIGRGGIPGTSGYFYGTYPWWDKLTHGLSASVVAAAGYTTVRVVDEHSESVTIPPAFVFVFVLLVTIAIGVLWEVIEFLVGLAPWVAGRTRTGFTQGSLENTMLDLVFNAVGAVVVAGWAHVYLTGVVESLARSLDREGTG